MEQDGNKKKTVHDFSVLNIRNSWLQKVLLTRKFGVNLIARMLGVKQRNEK